MLKGKPKPEESSLRQTGNPEGNPERIPESLAGVKESGGRVRKAWKDETEMQEGARLEQHWNAK